MKPSLMKHVGCDILDINPGPAIWSSKVHQLLQPRKHILMEPDEIYLPFLEPLLNSADSTYALHRGSGIVWNQLEKVLTEEHLPHQKELSRTDPRSFEPNETLLVLVNISFYPKRVYHGFSSLAHMIQHQLMSSITHRSLYHKYGLVRMLVWMDDLDRFLALPRHIHTKKKSSVETAVSCSHITEVASTTLPPPHFARHFDAELESARKTMAKMEVNGIKTPPGRESAFFEQLSDMTIEVDGLLRNRAEVERFSKELPELEAQYAAKEFEKYIYPEDEVRRRVIENVEGKTIGSRGAPNMSPYFSPLYMRMRSLRHLKNHIDRRTRNGENMVFEQQELISRQAELHHSTGSVAQEEKERLARLRKDIETRVLRLPDLQNIRYLTTLLETDRFSRTEPSGFLFDRRDVEPLRVKTDEFFPKRELALIDFEPREVWSVLKEDIAHYNVLEYVLFSFGQFPSWTVDAALKALWPGAYDYLVKECPSITDPLRGGDSDLTMITARSLNNDHIKDIVEAWIRWPFRPSRSQLLSRLSSVFDDDEEEGIRDVDHVRGHIKGHGGQRRQR
jgi:transcription factor 1